MVAARLDAVATRRPGECTLGIADPQRLTTTGPTMMAAPAPLGIDAFLKRAGENTYCAGELRPT